MLDKTEEQITFFTSDGGISHLINHHESRFIVAAAFAGLSYCQMLCMASGSVPFLSYPIHKFNTLDQLS
jgi:hypothetical protein